MRRPVEVHCPSEAGRAAWPNGYVLHLEPRFNGTQRRRDRAKERPPVSLVSEVSDPLLSLMIPSHPLYVSNYLQ